MRSTHSVHFFITPSTSEYSRAPYGHAHEHSWQPMHLASSTSTMPSSARLKLPPVGHTVTQAGVAQCRHERAKCNVLDGCAPSRARGTVSLHALLGAAPMPSASCAPGSCAGVVKSAPATS